MREGGRGKEGTKGRKERGNARRLIVDEISKTGRVDHVQSETNAVLFDVCLLQPREERIGVS